MRAWPLLVFLFSVLLMVLLTTSACAQEEVTILFTHDLHAHLDADAAGNGGFARLKTLVDEARAQGAALWFDAGDFSMGTPYQGLYQQQACEISLLGAMGLDGVTFGNHEFDMGDEGAAKMLLAASHMPNLIASNIAWDKAATKGTQALKAAFEQVGGSAYRIYSWQNLRVGVFALLGKSGQECAPTTELTFLDCVATAKSMVAQLKKEGADLIICLSHGGTDAVKSKSEDEQLASAVKDIDLIISGHTHTTLSQPLVVGDTYIASAGCYSANLGKITLARGENGRWRLENYELKPVTAQVQPDERTLAAVQAYQAQVTQALFSPYGYRYAQPLCQNAVDFGTDEEIQAQAVDCGLGNLLTDSYLYAVGQAENAPMTDTFAFVPSGIIRGTLPTGEVTVCDAFNLLPLGVGEDGVAGNPLVSVYLTGEELLTVAEVDASVSKIMTGTKLYVSGGGWEYNPHRLILARATRVFIKGGDPVQKDRLYRVIADMGSANMLSMVGDKSFGLLSIVPKDEAGQPVTDYNARVLHDAQGREIKCWTALANYLASMGTVPDAYNKPAGGIIVSDDRSLSAFFEKPTKIMVLAGTALVLVGGLVFSMIFFPVRALRRAAKKRRAASH